MISVDCQWCRTTFDDYPSNKRKYCTKKCFIEWQKENMVPPARKGIKLSKPIWNKGLRYGGVITTCPECEEAFRIQEYRILKATQPLYCSKPCRSKNCVTPENKRIRRSKEFANWRKAVFERDDYTCQFCGARGTELHPDHIKQFAYYPELRFDLDNGRTLCAPCHRATPTWGSHGRKKVLA